jgi:hypothetical protein
VLDANSWNLAHAELSRRQQPIMSGDHPAMPVDQDRDEETENPDAFFDLPDLFFLLCSRGLVGSSLSSLKER